MSTKIIRLNIERRYGLSNRVRAMAGHYALCKLKGWDLVYSWKPDPSCPSEFVDLFKTSKIISDDNLDLSNFGDVLNVGVGTKPTHCGSTEDAIYKAYFPDSSIKDKFELLVKKFYDDLSPVDNVQNIVEKLWLDAGADPENTLGLHVRRTDMVEHLRNIGEPPLSDKAVISEVDKYLEGNPNVNKIFLSCDNEESEKKFNSVYGDNLFCYSKNWISDHIQSANSVIHQSRLTSMQDALVDLIMLSQTRYIIGTRHSSFSTFAACIGDKKYIRI